MHINKKAFTLIELLVVILIIGILAAIALPQYLKAVEKSRASEALINIKAIARAQERHILATGSGTMDFDELDISIPGAVKTSPSEIETKYFTYQLRSTAGYVYAWRNWKKDNDNYYAFHVSMDTSSTRTRLLCGWTDNKYEAICRSFGSVSEAPLAWFGFTKGGAVWL
jgi:prepilin-type N-terminal cleavage/methylation domain-containing protein